MEAEGDDRMGGGEFGVDCPALRMAEAEALADALVVEAGVVENQGDWGVGCVGGAGGADREFEEVKL